MDVARRLDERTDRLLGAASLDGGVLRTHQVQQLPDIGRE